MTDLLSVEKAVKEAQPGVICHLASISDVDMCEETAHKEQVIRTNLRGTWNVALAASAYKCGVALISTDHVFNGKKGPYRETDLPKDPVNFYGMSKMAAEALRMEFSNLKIVRTSYLFNYERIFHTVLDPVAFYGKREFPTFLHRSFMFEGHFAESLCRYLSLFDKMPPILHISGSETLSWYEFALAAASVFGGDKMNILPRRKELKDGSLAPRPKKAGLQTRLSAKFLHQYSYLDGLKALKEEMG